MTEPIDLEKVNRLILYYHRRLERSNYRNPTINRDRLVETIQALEHYRDLCTIIDSPIEYIKQ